jgi:two-component system NtrC family response regulator
MKGCFDLLAQAAGSQSNVLIFGETGTGKELFARAIHNNSRSAEKNFVVVDCGSIPENLIGSILFGYEKGAFTGAERSREGLIKQAHEGTLFLDEVGELPLNDQKAFLRVLQERSFRPLGGKQEVKSDFRLVAATNRDLEEMVRLGRFREDLLFRLRTLTMELPPLRERSEDIMDLLLYFLRKLSKPAGKEIKSFSPEFLETLLNYPWPGNVREMIGAIEAAIHKSGNEAILFPFHLPPYIRIRMAQQGLQEKKGPEKPSEAIPTSLTDLQTLRETLEKEYLEELLAQTSGNINKACQISGVSRSRLYALLKKYQMFARLN